MNRSVDYTALITPTTRAEISAFTAATKAESKASGVRFRSAAPVELPRNARLAITGGVIVMALVVGGITAATRGGSFHLPGFDPAVLIVIVALVLAASFLYRVFFVRDWETRMRLSRFATANGLLFSASSAAPGYAGAIFGVGTSRAVSNRLRSTSGRFLDFGNYHYVTGSGKSRRQHSWGYLALQLDRRLPNMLLDSTANNGMFGVSNLPVGYHRDQRLSLEGDFDTHFTLYCPSEYERDALYVFTPDLMALLIDEAAPFDVEIVDEWMFVYSAKPFEPRDPAVYQRLFRIVDTIGAKTLSQTDRYVDERVGDPSVNVVAPAGRRLKRRIPVAAVVFALGIVVVFGGQFILRVLGA